MYAYPAINQENKQVVTASNMIVPEGIEFLYKYLLQSGQIAPVKEYNEENLGIYPSDIVDDIKMVVQIGKLKCLKNW